MSNIIQPLTRAQLYQMVTDLLFGFQMDSTLFNNFLDLSQAQREESRPWKILQTVDNSLSAGTGTTFTTPFAIAPTNGDFARWNADQSVVLVDANNNAVPYAEIPISLKFSYQKTSQYFYCDYTTNQLFLCGSLPQSYTIYQFYIKQALAVSYSPDGVNYPNTWVFPARFHKLLALDVALMYKQVNYDIINLQNAAQIQAQASMLFDQMTRWDSELSRIGSQGIDPYWGGQGWNATSSGGRIGII